jgi:PPK2 family polyphosphate:nucleotide phosphotransferase
VTDSPFLVKYRSHIDLNATKTSYHGKFKDKADVAETTAGNIAKLAKLQEVLYADNRYALLVVFQAMDAGGKDGAISHVFSGVNPQGCNVTNFKVPSYDEVKHDYLWRVHHAAPRRGMIGIFNRSHYESVLVERVKELVPRKVWSRRYDHINGFEKLLTDEGTVILKFFLHISKDEQKERLEARLADKDKRWKFSAADLAERTRWDKYMEAYQEAMRKCSTPWAPWYVIPSDHKWFRNWAIVDIIVRTLESLDLKYPAEAPGLNNLKVK